MAAKVQGRLCSVVLGADTEVGDGLEGRTERVYKAGGEAQNPQSLSETVGNGGRVGEAPESSVLQG